MDIAFNDNWLFTEDYDSGFNDAKLVRLPHTAKEIPYNYCDSSAYQMLCGYKKEFDVPGAWKGSILLLRFDGAAHDATVFCNGIECAHHSCGYTAFTADITDAVIFGEKNTVTVRLDTRESLNIPPFGFVIDYLCYGGLYREVTLSVREKGYISNVLIENSGLRDISAKIIVSEEIEGLKLCTDILDAKGKSVATAAGPNFKLSIPDGKLWSLENPVLYTVRVRLVDKGLKIYDEKSVRFGLRTVLFKNDGFYLNGEKIKLRGLNRHQSFPYVGYAMPKSMQRLDAEILKNELGVNAVRTSHYPQSQHFLDRCDELGLLVFTEIPGWQHIGDDEWQQQALQNVREMVMQNMHHPSIMLWGVRINESQDNNKLYKETNRIAHELDSSRQTSGVRYLEKSRLLEDVYAFNDFSHTGDNYGLKKKKDVSSNPTKPYLISECNGHMFPTKPYDDEAHRLNHALRHCTVLSSMYSDDDITGLFSWCMFDYNTHKDFGSGDGVCYHGVMDMFRNPKLAASVYRSQAEGDTVCTVSSSMDIGEHPAGNIGKVYALTNADSVKLYKDSVFVREFFPDTEKFGAMPHPPIIIDDFIGELLLTQEGYDEKTADSVKACLATVKELGTANLQMKTILTFAKLMLTKGFKIDDGYRLYSKYVSNWGGEATKWRFDAIKNGEAAVKIIKQSGSPVHLEFKTSHTTLTEESTYDVASIRIRALDAFGNAAIYYQEPIMLKAEGDIEIIGPQIISLKGGCGGTYIRTTAKNGSGRLLINGEEIEFTIE